MRHKNYSNFSKYNKNKNKNNRNNYNHNSITDNKIENSIGPTQVANNIITDTNTIGFVSGCKKLYVRAEPNKDSKPLCVIEWDTKVNIDLNESTMLFYKIKTNSGLEGYCMKEFISIV